MNKPSYLLWNPHKETNILIDENTESEVITTNISNSFSGREKEHFFLLLNIYKIVLIGKNSKINFAYSLSVKKWYTTKIEPIKQVVNMQRVTKKDNVSKLFIIFFIETSGVLFVLFLNDYIIT